MGDSADFLRSTEILPTGRPVCNDMRFIFARITSAGYFFPTLSRRETPMKHPAVLSINHRLCKPLNDGIAVYKSAIAKMEHDDCKELFSELIACREFALDYLQPYVVFQTGAPELGHGFAR